MATEKPTVVEALLAVMEDVRGVAKREKHDAPGAKFMFRGIDSVVNAVGPALRTHRVLVMPMLESADHRDVRTSNDKASRECTVQVRYRFYGPSGDHIDAVVPGESMDSGDKGTAKAMSVAFRIALLQALCLPTDDTDPDAQSYERGAPMQRQRPTEQQNGHVEDSAPAARKSLAAHCEQMGYDLGAVAAKFREKYRQELGEATDATRVRAFTKLLAGMPELELKAAAGNGATQ